MKTKQPLRSFHGPSSMRGVSMIGWMLIVIVVVVMGTALLKIVPAYMEYNTIKTSINRLLQDGKVGLLSEKEVQGRLESQFIINSVNAISAKDLEVEKNAGTLSVGVDYEVRENLFYNVDVVVSFEEEFSKSIR